MVKVKGRGYFFSSAHVPWPTYHVSFWIPLRMNVVDTWLESSVFKDFVLCCVCVCCSLFIVLWNMIQCLFVGNIVVCIVIFLFVINSKFRNRVIQEWQVQTSNVQARLLSSSPNSNKKRKTSNSPTDKSVPPDLPRPSVDDDIIREHKAEPGPDSQVGKIRTPPQITTTVYAWVDNFFASVCALPLVCMTHFRWILYSHFPSHSGML